MSSSTTQVKKQTQQHSSHSVVETHSESRQAGSGQSAPSPATGVRTAAPPGAQPGPAGSVDKQLDVPVARLDFAVIDREFGSARERFQAEMKRIDEEMQRWRKQFISQTPNMPMPAPVGDLPGGMSMSSTQSSVQEQSDDKSRSRTVSRQTVTQTSSSTSTVGGLPSLLDSCRPGAVDAQGKPSFGGDLHKALIESPLVVTDEADGGEKLKLRFDVAEYKPEEIQVKTIGSKLSVEARHEEQSDAKSVMREFKRDFQLPPTVDPQLLHSSLSTDGVLTVEAPLSPPVVPAADDK